MTSVDAAKPMVLRHIIAWAAVFAVSTALVKAAYLGLGLFLGAVLPPDVYAGFGLLYAAQTAMGTFAGVGVQEITIGRLKGHSSGTHRRELFRNAVRLFYVTAILALVITGVAIANAKSSAVTATAMAAALLLGGLNAFAVLQAGLIRLEERHAGSLAYSAGVPLMACAGSAIGIWWTGSLESVFVGGVVAAALAIGLLAASRHGYADAWPRWYGLWRDLRSLAPFAITSALGWLSGYGFIFVVNGMFDPVDVAHYTFLYMVSSVSQMVASAMNMVWSPRFYRLFLSDSAERAELQSRRFFLLQAMSLGLTGAFGVATVPWLAEVIGGHLDAYGGMRLELALLFAGYVVVVPWWHAQNYYLVSNQGVKLMRIVLWTSVAGLCAWVVCMLVFGPIGIYVGIVIQTAIKSYGAWLGSRRQWAVSPPWVGIAIAVALTFAGLIVPEPGEV